jgi:hypothetical protein
MKMKKKNSKVSPSKPVSTDTSVKKDQVVNQDIKDKGIKDKGIKDKGIRDKDIKDIRNTGSQAESNMRYDCFGYESLIDRSKIQRPAEQGEKKSVDKKLTELLMNYSRVNY